MQVNSSRSSPLKFRLLAIIISFLFVVFILEFGVRIYDYAKNGIGFFSDERNLISKGFRPLIPFRTFGFKLYRTVDGVRYISSCHNELFPIKKPAGTFRIVTFGGSSTENMYAYREAEIHYPLLLLAELRDALNTKSIEVINVAFSAYATPHSLILFALDVLSWEPDLIIVSHNINDLTAAYWPDFTFDYSNKYSNEFYAIPNYRSVYTLPNILFQHSRLYWFLHHRIEKIKENQAVPIQRKSYGKQPPKAALNVFKRNLRSFAQIAHANKIKVLFGNQPIQPDKEYFLRHTGNKPYNSIIVYPLHEELLAHHRIFNTAIRQVADEMHVMFLDNDSILAGNKDYFVDFIHYTPKGVRILAHNYADYLLRNNVIQLPKAE